MSDDSPRILPVGIPTVAFKGPEDTDAKLFRKVADAIDRSHISGSNVKTAVSRLLRNVAQALEVTGESDPESSYYAYHVDRNKARSMRFEWTERAGEVRGNLVYVLYSDTLERPLYVGMTIDIVNRLAGHRNGPAKKSWYNDVRRVVITPCADSDAAARYERELIQKLNPVHNQQRYEVA